MRWRCGYHQAMKRRQFIYGGVAAVAIAASGYGVSRLTDRSSGEPLLAEKNPPEQVPAATLGEVPEALWSLALPDINGETQALSQWRGAKTVINFWATWCAPCVKEMPDLNALHHKHPNVRFVGIGIDSAANIRAFLDKVPVDYPLLVQGAGGIDLLRRLGNTQGGLPFTLILDEDGVLRHRILGQIDPADLDVRVA